MKKEYLSEAFRQLELLNEEDFNLSTTADNSDLKDFLDNDDISVMSLDVIDPEAETEEDLEDSYTGKVILDCCVCHSKLYKDKEEVQIDEEQDLANVGEECPFCYSNDGFKIIGEEKGSKNQRYYPISCDVFIGPVHLPVLETQLKPA